MTDLTRNNSSWDHFISFKKYPRDMSVVRILARLAFPTLCVIIILVFHIRYSRAEIFRTRSIKAFFDITGSLHVMTWLIAFMIMYMIFVPIMYLDVIGFGDVYIPPDQGKFHLRTTSGDHVLTLNSGRSVFPNNFLQELRFQLSPLEIKVEFDDTAREFVFLSKKDFTIVSDSTLTGVLGIPTGVDIKSTPTSFSFLSGTCECSNIYLIRSTPRLNINSPNVPSTFLNYKNTIRIVDQPTKAYCYLVAIVVFLIWRTYMLNRHRSLGWSIDENVISEAELKLFTQANITIGRFALVLVFYIYTYLVFVTVTNQDLITDYDLKNQIIRP